MLLEEFEDLLDELLGITTIPSLEELLDKLVDELKLLSDEELVDDNDTDEEVVLTEEDELISDATEFADCELTLAVEDLEEGIGVSCGELPDEPPPQAVSIKLTPKAHRLRNA